MVALETHITDEINIFIDVYRLTQQLVKLGCPPNIITLNIFKLTPVQYNYFTSA